MAKSARRIPLRQQPAFRKLRELLQQSGQRDLLWYHRAGDYVEQLFPREGGRQYGHSRMAEITNALGKSENFTSALYEYRDFFWGYDRSEVKRLSNADNTKGFRLTFSHFRHLLSVDEAERIRFQKDCIKAEWSSKELHRAIKDYRGHKSAGGKPFVRPETLDAGLRQLTDESEAWIRRHRRVWFAPDAPVISEESKQQNPEQIPKLFDAAIESWETMEFLIKEHLPRLRRTRASLKKAAAREPKRKTAKRAKPKKKALRKR